MAHRMGQERCTATGMTVVPVSQRALSAPSLGAITPRQFGSAALRCALKRFWVREDVVIIKAPHEKIPSDPDV